MAMQQTDINVLHSFAPIRFQTKTLKNNLQIVWKAHFDGHQWRMFRTFDFKLQMKFIVIGWRNKIDFIRRM